MVKVRPRRHGVAEGSEDQNVNAKTLPATADAKKRVLSRLELSASLCFLADAVIFNRGVSIREAVTSDD